MLAPYYAAVLHALSSAASGPSSRPPSRVALVETPPAERPTSR
jgi:hypothetical protein